jgi:hypothetical protein
MAQLKRERTPVRAPRRCRSARSSLAANNTVSSRAVRTAAHVALMAIRNTYEVGLR